ncbi:MAG: hypothetical protein ACLUOI_08515 [Eisenbergiella sp.]
MVQDENQRLIGQVARSVESYLRTIMKLSDSLYYGAVKNADLSSESVGSELTLLYDNNKDNGQQPVGGFMLVEAVPAARLKPNLDVTGGRVQGCPGKDGKPTFRFPMCSTFLTIMRTNAAGLSHCPRRGTDKRHLHSSGYPSGGYQLLKPGTAL